MEFLNWLNKSFLDVERSLLFNKYFANIKKEEGVDIVFFFNPQMGIDIVFDTENLLKSIHFYSGKEMGAHRFEGILPLSIDFDFSKEDIIKLLGIANESGGGGSSFLYKTVPFWDKYIFQNFFIHIQYEEKADSITLVTLERL